ncbi:MAG TPA: type II toxin-antitoxin system VapC family toxin [Candidatus Acidoferrales bacterium]|jgi:ribonuclease VapC|nr:type II toxin-antitoxin system VapC family toxin [Candidatus Acidoferrales bacterium]
MIVDTSAIVAILRDEPDAASFASAIEAARIRRVSAVNFVEPILFKGRDFTHTDVVSALG